MHVDPGAAAPLLVPVKGPPFSRAGEGASALSAAASMVVPALPAIVSAIAAPTTMRLNFEGLSFEAVR